jgi:putative hydrolase of the HAD superfamily
VIDAVLFDWGGTLSSWADVDLLAMWHTAALVLAPDDPEPVAQRLLDAELHAWETHTAAGDRSFTTEELLRGVASETGLDVLSAAQTAYLDAWAGSGVQHDPHALDVLTALKDRGIKTGLLSNTHWPRAVHEHWLEKDGLLDLLDVRLYTSEMAHMKPHAEAFRALLDAVGVDDPSTAVFVGDRPRDDIAGAQAVGMRGVLLAGRPVPAAEVEADAEIEDLRDLVDVVDRWRT